MVWVSFLEDFNFTPSDKPQVSVGYKAGREYNVPRECAEQSIAAGKSRAVSGAPSEPVEEIATKPQFEDETLDAFEVEAEAEVVSDGDIDVADLLANEFAHDGNED